jgi:hypothetical protein
MLIKCKEKYTESWALAAHAYNPGYSGGKDQEDQALRPAQTNSLQRPVSKKTHHKIGLVVWLKV